MNAETIARAGIPEEADFLSAAAPLSLWRERGR
jgi:hypothetical protein